MISLVPSEKKCFLERTELDFVVYLYQILFNTAAFLSRHLTCEYASVSTLGRWPQNVLPAATPGAPLWMTLDITSVKTTH